MERLGLWGEGTAFESKKCFVDMLQQYGVGEHRGGGEGGTGVQAGQGPLCVWGGRARWPGGQGGYARAAHDEDGMGAGHAYCTAWLSQR